MTARILAFACLALTAGCFTSRTPQATHWLLAPSVSEQSTASAPAFDEARLAVVFMRSPYDGKSIVVLRPDGSVAFDPYNQFAAQPTALIKGTALDVIRHTGLFKGVQPSITTADVKLTLELVIDQFALDCREKGERKATVDLTLVMIERRHVVAARRGSASADVKNGDYSAAFGSAFTQALTSAAAKLPK